MTFSEIQNLLTTACHAPSGDNSQPWQFLADEEHIELINLPDRDNEIFNFHQRGSYIAHGAVLENIRQLAPIYGASADIRLFPKSGSTAEVRFTAREKIPDTVSQTIKARSTNRKKYSLLPLSAEQKNTLLQNTDRDLGELMVVEDLLNKKIIAEAASGAERIMLGYKPLHDAFFSMIRWNQKEETNKSGGLLIDTLELQPPQKLIFKWFSHWQASLPLRALGLPAFIASENSKIYAASSAMGAIVMEKTDPENFIQTGMRLQRLWLNATRMNLSLQPIAGILYLGQRLAEAGMPDLPKNLQNLISDSVKNIYRSFGHPSGTITMLFRVGQGQPPSAHSSKHPPLITYQRVYPT